MADPSTCLPLTPDSISKTYDRIKQYIHKTPLITSRSLNHIASHPDARSFFSENPPAIWSDPPPPPSSSSATTTTSLPPPKLNLFLKLESHQRIGAFKARGAFSAITHLINEVGLDSLQKRGVITHSSGNHAQALALAASTFKIPAWIVMPSISTKSKIAGVRSFEHAGAGVKVIFSGSTAPEREAKVAEVIESQAQANSSNEGPIIVPPYDHPDIILGQGTVGLEMEAQFQNRQSGLAKGCAGASGVTSNDNDTPNFDIVLAPLGGGGLLSGVATWFSHTHTPSPSNTHHKTLTIGTEPSYQGANDAEIGLAQHKRIPHVRTLTIADGLRTPVGLIPWSIISNSDPDKQKFVESVFSVSELEIKMALKILMERVKVVVEPSSAVPVAVVLFNARFREWVEQRRRMEVEAQKARGVEQEDGEERAWNVGIVLSGGNTTVEGLSELFREGWLEEKEDGEGKGVVGEERQRETGQVGLDGKKVAEDVAG